MKTSLKARSCLGFITALALAASPVAHAEQKIPDEYKTGGFFIGCIVYTFDRFSLFEALEKTAEAGGTVVELSAKKSLSKEEPDVPFDYHASPEVIQKVRTSWPSANSKR